MNKLENLKNEFKIPEGIDLAVKKGIERGKKQRKIKKFQSAYKKAAVVAVILVATALVVITHSDSAMAIPGVQSIFKLIGYGNMGENLEWFEEFSTGINEAMEKNGVKVTIDEVIIDDNTLAITSTAEGENLREVGGYSQHIMLNGKLVKGYSSKDKKTNDNTLKTVTYANISDLDLSELVDVEINIIWIGDVKGPWNFKFQVPKADKQTDSKIINLDKTIKIPESTLSFDDIVISSLGNTLNYSGTYDKVYDNISEETFENMKGFIWDFIVTDDKGKVMQTRGGTSSSTEKYDGKLEIFNDLTNVKALTVTPIFKPLRIRMMDVDNHQYPILQTTINSSDFNIPQEIITKSRDVSAEEKASGYIFDKVIHVFNIDKARAFSSINELINQSIKVGSNNTILIKNIEVSENETKVTFKIEGNGLYPYIKISEIVIIDENYNDVERTEGGELAVLENSEEGIVSIKLAPIDTTKKYKIALPIIEEPEIEEQYKTNIDLSIQK